MRQAFEIDTPTPSIVRRCLADWGGDSSLALPDEALALLFLELAPANADVGDVLLKVAALNQLFSTHLYDVRGMAKHIVALRVDGRLCDGDLSLVGEIARFRLRNGKERRFLSFATKYCSFHRPDCYAVYDRHVCTALRHFLRVDRFASCRPSSFRDYEVFHTAVESFRAAYGLQEFTLKDIDRYLWQVGRAIEGQAR